MTERLAAQFNDEQVLMIGVLRQQGYALATAEMLVADEQLLATVLGSALMEPLRKMAATVARLTEALG